MCQAENNLQNETLAIKKIEVNQNFGATFMVEDWSVEIGLL